MLSTNVILLAIVMIGLIYLYCNNNFREGVCKMRPGWRDKMNAWANMAQNPTAFPPQEGGKTGTFVATYPNCFTQSVNVIKPLIGFVQQNIEKGIDDNAATACPSQTDEASCTNALPWGDTGATGTCTWQSCGGGKVVTNQSNFQAWWDQGGSPQCTYKSIGAKLGFGLTDGCYQPGTTCCNPSDAGLNSVSCCSLGGLSGAGATPAQYCAKNVIADACVWTEPQPTCTPNCAGKNCGDNGCGGSCGTCSSGQTCTNGTCKTPAPPVVACPPSCSDGERTGDSNCSDITCSNCCTTPTCPATCSGGQTRSADAKCKSMTDCTNCCANNPCPQTCDSESMRTKDSNCTNTACSNCCTKKPAACSSFTCPDNTVPKPQDPIPIVCEGNPCTLNECCNNKAVCNTITCQSNYYNQDPTKICSGAICNPSECCIQDPTCQGYECPKYYTSHSDSGEIICENGVCNTGTCCVENNNCSNFADCPDFTHPKADGNNIICQNKNCTEEECCGENPYCSTYYCPQTFYKTGKLISNASSAQCSNFPCTDDECCTFSPSGKLPEIRIWPIYKGQV